MSSDEVSEYENDSLIKQKLERNTNSDIIVTNNGRNCAKCIYQCTVITLLLTILAIILLTGGWAYASHGITAGINSIPQHMSSTSSNDDVDNTTRTSGITELYDLGIGLWSLPSNTLQAVYDYDEIEGITPEQESVLRAIFHLMDLDKDNRWNLHEFELFIDGAIQPEINFDRMDFDDDAVLSMKEIYLLIEAFDHTDVYECSSTDHILADVFGYEQLDTEDRGLFYEYIAQLWLYQLDTEEIGVISKEKYVKYIEDEEWDYHNHNGDDHVDFNEFKDKFFDSVYYQSWKRSMDAFKDDEDSMTDIFVQLDNMDDSAIAAVKLTTTPHQYDTEIFEYIGGNSDHSDQSDDSEENNHEHSASESLLYALPNVYFANNLFVLDPSNRRRLAYLEVNSVGWQFSWAKMKWEGMCFSEESKVNVLKMKGIVEVKELKDVKVGEYVFDGMEYTKIIAVEKGDLLLKMIKLYMNDTFIILSEDHLLYDYNNQRIPAGNLKIGSKIYNDFVVYDIEYGLYHLPVTPFTMSGMIQVNDVKASNYIISDAAADAAHKLLAPFRFVSEYVNEYYPAMIIQDCLWDNIHLYKEIFGEHQYDLLFLFDIHPLLNVFIDIIGAFVIYGKYVLLNALSMIM
eukprot:102143_1